MHFSSFEVIRLETSDQLSELCFRLFLLILKDMNTKKIFCHKGYYLLACFSGNILSDRCILRLDYKDCPAFMVGLTVPQLIR